MPKAKTRCSIRLVILGHCVALGFGILSFGKFLVRLILAAPKNAFAAEIPFQAFYHFAEQKKAQSLFLTFPTVLKL